MSSFEFIIDGPPISQFARQREGLHAWKDLVRAEAERLWPPGSLPSNASLRITVTYYYEDSPVDTNGIVKPITDALIGLVFNDNSQIEGLTQSRQDLHASFRIPDFTPVLAEGFGRGREFLHVKIDGLPPLGERLQETRPEVLQDESLQLESAPIQDVGTQSLEFSPEGTSYPQTSPSFQNEQATDEEPESPGPDVVAQELQPESPQTASDENAAEQETPGSELPDQEKSEVDTQTELDEGQEGEESSDLFNQEPALQEVDEQEMPEDSQSDLDQPAEPEEDATTIEGREN